MLVTQIISLTISDLSALGFYHLAGVMKPIKAVLHLYIATVLRD